MTQIGPCEARVHTERGVLGACISKSLYVFLAFRSSLGGHLMMRSAKHYLGRWLEKFGLFAVALPG